MIIYEIQSNFLTCGKNLNLKRLMNSCYKNWQKRTSPSAGQKNVIREGYLI